MGVVLAQPVGTSIMLCSNVNCIPKYDCHIAETTDRLVASSYNVHEMFPEMLHMHDHKLRTEIGNS